MKKTCLGVPMALGVITYDEINGVAEEFTVKKLG